MQFLNITSSALSSAPFATSLILSHVIEIIPFTSVYVAL